MKPVSTAEIKSVADYELERPSLRPKLMELKDRRRLRVGGHLTFLFENRDTVRYQIQEMMRIERLEKPAEIRHEVETYNELIPGPNELSASLLIEYETPEERAIWLRELLGLEDHVWLEVEGAGRAKARFDDRQISTDRLSSVQYIKFPLSPEQAAAFARGASVVVDHPRYSARSPIAGEQMDELRQDLVG
jgi:hypothetical protein